MKDKLHLAMARKLAATFVGIMLIMACAMVATGCSQQEEQKDEPIKNATISVPLQMPTTNATVNTVDGNTLTVTLEGEDLRPIAERQEVGRERDEKRSAQPPSADFRDTNTPPAGGAPGTAQPAQPEGVNPNGPGAEQSSAGQGAEAPASSEGTAQGVAGAPEPASEAQSTSTANSESASSAASAESTASSSSASAESTSTSEASSSAAQPEEPQASPMEIASITIPDDRILFKAEKETMTQIPVSEVKTKDQLMITVENGTEVTKIIIFGNDDDPDNSSSYVGTSANAVSSAVTEDGQTYETANQDETALRIDGTGDATLTNATIKKSGDTSIMGPSSFYGLDSGILVHNGGKLSLSNSTVTSDGEGANAIFVHGDNSTATLADTTVTVTSPGAGGIQVAGGGTSDATNVTVETSGMRAATVRGDEGGGNLNLNGGSFISHGEFSPAVYCAATLKAENAEMRSDNSEILVVLRDYSAELKNCKLTCNVNGGEATEGVVPNIMIYETGHKPDGDNHATLDIEGGSIEATHGTLFYVTNAFADISLSDVDINSKADTLLTVAGNEMWGDSTETNGGDATLSVSNQKLEGDIVVDEVSTLKLTLGDSTDYEGAINTDGDAGTVDVQMESGSTWKLTGDSYVSSLEGTTNGIDLNGHKLFVGGKAWSK